MKSHEVITTGIRPDKLFAWKCSKKCADFGNYTLPSAQALIKGAQALLENAEFELSNYVESRAKEDVFLHPTHPFAPPPKSHFSAVQGDQPNEQEQSPFRRRVQGWDQLQSANQFLAAVAARFDADEYLLTVDKVKLPAEMQVACDRLLRQLNKLRRRVDKSLPVVLSRVQKKYPKAPAEEIYVAALKLIDEQLMPVLSTIYIWTTGLKQWLNPKYNEKMRILRAAIEQKLFLLLTGNLNLPEADDLSNKNSGNIAAKIKTIAVSVGDLVIPVLIGPTDGGPAVIPMTGELGPQGAHAMLFPQEFLHCLALIDPIYSHEMGHLFFAVVVGLAQALAETVEAAIRQGHADGSLKFKTDEIEIADGITVATVDFAVKIFSDHLDELFADLIGELVSGPPAFSAAFVDYLGSAASLAQGGIENAGPLFGSRSDYIFAMGNDYDDLLFEVEPHPQDEVRLKWLAVNARRLGFVDAARGLEKLRKQECARRQPRMLTWTNGAAEDDFNSDFVISWSVADYNQVSSLLSRVIPNSRLAPLNQMTLKELICFTPQMQKEKVDKLVALLKAGDGNIPCDGRKYWLHFVGAASVLAYDQLVDEGMPSSEAIELVAAAANAMMQELTGEWEATKRSCDLYKLARKSKPKQSRAA